jgi:hypothetical protein
MIAEEMKRGRENRRRYLNSTENSGMKPRPFSVASIRAKNTANENLKRSSIVNRPNSRAYETGIAAARRVSLKPTLTPGLSVG